MKYQLIGPPIEAIQFDGSEASIDRVREFGGGLTVDVVEGAGPTLAREVWVFTPAQGMAKIDAGDWIAADSKGEPRIVRAADFARYYREVPAEVAA